MTPLLCPAPLGDGSPCSRPASLWDPARGGFVCEAHAPPTEPYRRRVVAQMERLDRVSQTRFLIGARWE